MLDTIETNHAKDQAKAQMESISEMVARLRHCQDCDAGDPTAVEGLCEFDTEYHNEDEAEQAIREHDEVCKDETYRDGKWVPIAELLVY